MYIYIFFQLSNCNFYINFAHGNRVLLQHLTKLELRQVFDQAFVSLCIISLTAFERFIRMCDEVRKTFTSHAT